MAQYPLIWRGPIDDPGPEAEECRLLVRGLKAHGYPVSICPVSSPLRMPLRPEEKRLFESMRLRNLDGPYFFFNHVPTAMVARDLNASLNLARFSLETDRVPVQWLESIKALDGIFVPSVIDERALIRSGITQSKIHLLPPLLDESVFTPMGPKAQGPPGNGFTFMAIYDPTPGGGLDLLLKIWTDAFPPGSDVRLLLIVPPWIGIDTDRARQEILNFMIQSGKPPPDGGASIHCLNDPLDPMHWAALYRSADCFIALKRTESVNRHALKAMACGVPCVTAVPEGMAEHVIDEHNGFPLPTRRRAVSGKASEMYPQYHGHLWLEPDSGGLQRLLVDIVSCPDEGRQRGQRASEEIHKLCDQGRAVEKLIHAVDSISPKPSHHGVFQSCAPDLLKIAWEGPFFSPESLARVNRELSEELMRLGGIDLTPIPIELEPQEVLVKKHRDVARKARPIPREGTALTIRHGWPPHWARPPGGKWVLIQPWELSSIPASWIKPIHDEVDEVWVPTRFVRSAFVDSGVAPEKVHVVPNGINASVFAPRGPMVRLAPDGRFLFLFVGGSIGRKGIDLLLKAWRATFTAQDPVSLLIKDMGTNGVYRKRNYVEQIKAMQQDKTAAPIIYWDHILSDEEMATLYRSCDVLIHPYRGEGFALPVAEALGCGLPVMVTGGGATEDFVDMTYAFRIPSKQVPVQYSEPTAKPAWWLEPDFDRLCEIMRDVTQRKAELKQMGAVGSRAMHDHWTWRHAARKALIRINALTAVRLEDEAPSLNP